MCVVCSFLAFNLLFVFFFFFFKQKTAYEMRISDWSSDVCSSDLSEARNLRDTRPARAASRLITAAASPPTFSRSRTLETKLTPKHAETPAFLPILLACRSRCHPRGSNSCAGPMTSSSTLSQGPARQLERRTISAAIDFATSLHAHM